MRGRFFYLGERKLLIRGVTYGPLAPTAEGAEWEAEQVAQDFAAMAQLGINAVRLYTVPPRWMLDAALAHGLFVLVGVPWEQHVAFLDDRARVRSIDERVGAAVDACAGHPAVLAYAVGNEVPTEIVRWLGRRRVERFLGRLCRTARRHDPGALVTYVTYPATEYLRLGEVDFLAFNVYLETEERFDAYLARLQNLADDRPLLLTELGLDDQRNGLDRQAQVLDWQLRRAFASGAAGAFVFGWTDDWHRGGAEITDWSFGLTTRARTPKPAARAVAEVYGERLVTAPAAAPRISVVVCTYNGARTLPDCLAGIAQLDYPDFEVIVVDDGSTDDSARLAADADARVISTPNRGLSCARNTGMEAANGDIVAFIDDDARPDPDWLTFLARVFVDPQVAGAGGPNVLPVGSSAIASCVANAPGGPTHVLLSDRNAEHLPGCNLAVRREVLQRIGGFDPRFRVAGDDVDLCWRLLADGHRLAFSPGAVVWHHRRSSVRAYLRQQRGYGRAEALLERKWPERYGVGGHVSWAGRLYGNGSAQHRGGWRWRVYYGAWGTGSFQSLYGPPRGILEALPLMPEWYLLILALTALSLGGIFAMPLLALAISALLFDAGLGAARARFPGVPAGRRRLALRGLTAVLYLAQPLARLRGRLGEGLVPWRRRGPRGLSPPVPRTLVHWSETWRSSETRVRGLERTLARDGAVVVSGGDWDRWDLQVRTGPLGVVRLRATVEEHGSGQLVRLRYWPRVTVANGALVLGAAALGLVSALAASMLAAFVLGVLAIVLALRAAYEYSRAAFIVRRCAAAAGVELEIGDDAR